jgi:hypothetical protein
MVIDAIVVRDAIRPGRSNAVYSIVIVAARPRDDVLATNREPRPIGSSEMSRTLAMRGLYAGSWRSSATKSKTTSRGTAMTISPSMLAVVSALMGLAGGRSGSFLPRRHADGEEFGSRADHMAGAGPAGCPARGDDEGQGGSDIGRRTRCMRAHLATKATQSSRLIGVKPRESRDDDLAHSRDAADAPVPDHVEDVLPLARCGLPGDLRVHPQRDRLSDLEARRGPPVSIGVSLTVARVTRMPDSWFLPVPRCATPDVAIQAECPSAPLEAAARVESRWGA